MNNNQETIETEAPVEDQEQDEQQEQEEETGGDEEDDEMDEDEQLRVMAETAWADVEHEFSMLTNDVAMELGGSSKGGVQTLMVTLAAVVDVLGILEGVLDTGLVSTLLNWILYVASPMTYVMKISKMKQMVMKMSPERASRRFGKLIGCSWSRFMGYCMWRIVELVPVAEMFPSWTKTTWQERHSEQRKLLQLKALQKDLDEFGVKLKGEASKKKDDALANMRVASTLREEVKVLDDRYMSIC